MKLFLDKNELEQASSFLSQAAESNVLQFIKTLSDILRHGGNSSVARMAAGLQLKNQLTSKDPNIKALYQQRWLAYPEDVRNYIKKNVSWHATTHVCEFVTNCRTIFRWWVRWGQKQIGHLQLLNVWPI